MTAAPRLHTTTNGEANKLYPGDRAVHDWYRFVLSFPPQLVREYLARFGVGERDAVLDPFCGTGTTLVECKKLGIPSVGVEANPIACFASRTKASWDVDPNGLEQHAREVARIADERCRSEGIEDAPVFQALNDGHVALRALPREKHDLLLTNSISPLPLHKTMVLLECLRAFHDDRYEHHEILALAKALVYSIGNLEFGPEVGVGTLKSDAPVIGPWLAGVRAMAEDLRSVQDGKTTRALVHQADARQILNVVEPGSIAAVITSPPYPNEKDYSRTTRLESVLLGFVSNKKDLQQLKRGLVRSNTRSVYKGDSDDLWVIEHSEIQRIAAEIEARRVELGKTSGFERMYARVTKLYFGGMARHLADLRHVLRPGAQLAYVVGDQASYLRVMIRTGQLLGDIARRLGYDLVSIDLFRTRLATATREQLREEVVVLRWPG